MTLEEFDKTFDGYDYTGGGFHLAFKNINIFGQEDVLLIFTNTDIFASRGSDGKLINYETFREIEKAESLEWHPFYNDNLIIPLLENLDGNINLSKEFKTIDEKTQKRILSLYKSFADFCEFGIGKVAI